MPRRIIYDGLNLALLKGTGIATYTRMLAQTAREIGHRTGVVYSSRFAPPRAPLLREIAFFDDPSRAPPRLRGVADLVADQFRCHWPLRPAPVELSGAVVGRQFDNRLPQTDEIYLDRNLFANAGHYFNRTGEFVTLDFPQAPDIFHCTYQMPLRARRACNVYTLHDLVPLRLPFATLDNKRRMYRLLKKIAAKADHIVTVSENSRQDIIRLLGVEESRVTNTYQAVSFPPAALERSDDEVAEELDGSYGLTFGKYLLFYGAIEPKKNIGRLIEAYLSSGVDIPLVLVSSGGWQNQPEIDFLAEQRARRREGEKTRREVRRLDFVSVSMLVSLIRGAAAGVFPSLYEGFGLPVLECMQLGTPVITSGEASLPEVASEAALMVNPYSVAEIAGAIRILAHDADLRADLARRGRVQAGLFTPERYRERVAKLYERIG